ncbi:MAG: helix-turn-helix transcriptional regulator [Clostridia bacterium]|nr:helix-turn-helix transcriptional regulator [Clostridia bacterium]
MENLNLSKKEIIERIGYFRNLRNISAYKLGIELGHSKTYFYRIESGEIQLTVDMLLDILDILQVTTTEFFSPTLKDDDKKLFEMISNLSLENKQTIVDLIKKLKQIKLYIKKHPKRLTLYEGAFFIAKKQVFKKSRIVAIPYGKSDYAVCFLVYPCGVEPQIVRIGI